MLAVLENGYSTTLGANLVTSSAGGLALRSSNNTVLTQFTTFTSSLALTASLVNTTKATSPNNGLHYLALVTQSGADVSAREVRWSTSIYADPTTSTMYTERLIATSVSASLTGSLTGALIGTSSWAINANTASYSPSGFPYTGNAIISGSLVVTNGSGGITGSISGSVAAPGNTGEVIYNNAGSMAAAGNVEISAVGNLNLVSTTDPTAPAASIATLYSKNIAGRAMPKVIDSNNLSYLLDTPRYMVSEYYWQRGTTTDGTWTGTTGTGTGTFADATRITTGGGTLLQSMKRSTYANVATTLSQSLGQNMTETIFFRGAVTNQGGFFYYARGGFEIWTAGGRFFAGTSTAVSTIINSNAEPSTINNHAGFLIDSTDAGMSFSIRNAATTTKTPITAFTASAGKVYDMFIHNPPFSSNFSYTIIDLATGAEVSNTVSATPPVAGTVMGARFLGSNASLTAVNSVSIAIQRIYITTAYS